MDRIEMDAQKLIQWHGPEWDPVPDYLIDRFRAEDLFKMQHIKMRAWQQVLQIQLKAFSQQMEIIEQYTQMRAKEAKA